MLTQQICCGIIIVNKYVYTTPPGIRRKEMEESKMLKRYNTWDDLQKCKDKRVLIIALQELKRNIGYEPQAIDLLNVIWDDHLKVIAC